MPRSKRDSKWTPVVIGLGVAASIPFAIFLPQLLIVVAIQAALVVVLSHLTANQLPRALRTQAKTNWYRIDGTISDRRRRAEIQAIKKLRRSMLGVIACLFVVSNLGLAVVHSCFVPLPLCVSALAKLQVSDEHWKESLRYEEAEFDRIRASEMTEQELRDYKFFVWKMRPAWLLIAVSWLAAVSWLLRSTYQKLVHEFQRELKIRTHTYRVRDERSGRDRGKSLWPRHSQTTAGSSRHSEHGELA
ncbi:MAG: hypothetical protein R3E01_18770 [Pirellulaceae bacterium]|nr:hypothetical protein [Planctomycetales bacterium]